MLSPLRTPNGCFGSLTNMRQILQPKCRPEGTRFCDSLFHQGFADAMIDIFLKPLFSASITFQAPFGVAGHPEGPRVSGAVDDGETAYLESV